MKATTFFSKKLPKDPRDRFSELERMGYAPLYTLYQEHGDDVICLPAPYAHPGTEKLISEQAHGDAIVTNQPGLYVGVKTADCVPILLWDETAGVCAAVHAGWRGTALGILYKTVETMSREFGAVPERIEASIGPCICKKCFETHRDVPDALPKWAEPCITPLGSEKFLVDLANINRLWLNRAGVTKITMPPACTACDPETYWSHRRHGSERGLQVSLVGITSPLNNSNGSHIPGGVIIV